MTVCLTLFYSLIPYNRVTTELTSLTRFVIPSVLRHLAQGICRKIRNNDLSDTILVMIRQTLHFLIMAWHCRVTKLTYRQTATPFLVVIVDLLLTRPTIQYEDALIDAIITALALVETLRKEPDSIDINKLWEDDDIWNLCLRHKPSNLAVACESIIDIRVTVSHWSDISSCFLSIHRSVRRKTTMSSTNTVGRLGLYPQCHVADHTSSILGGRWSSFTANSPFYIFCTGDYFSPSWGNTQ